MAKKQWQKFKAKKRPAPGESPARIKWRMLVNNRLLEIEILLLQLLAKNEMEPPIMMHEAKTFIRDAVLSISVEEE